MTFPFNRTEVTAVFRQRLEFLQKAILDPSTTNKLRRMVDVRINELKQLAKQIDITI